VHPLKDLERAYVNFFEKRAAFPRFKKKGQRDSFRYPDPKQIKLDKANSRLLLPKLGWVRYRNSREVLGEVRNVTVSQSGGKWFVSIQTERDIERPVHPSGSIVGVDVGIARFATLSNGTVIESLGSFKKHEQSLAGHQRAMTRKKKFSNNWKKAKAKVQRIHTRIADARRDHLHKATSTISQNHAIVCIEDLRVKNMSKSAAGSLEQPGRNVKAKSALNRSILDQGWFEFRRQLEYKQDWRGGRVIEVPPKNTSRTCPRCGHMSAENRRTQVQFACVECGFEQNADLVGAINILRAGHARLACGEMVQSGRSVKQEPTEATQAVEAFGAVGIFGL
jgi:putative transposase